MKFNEDGVTAEYGEFLRPWGVSPLDCGRLFTDLFAMSEKAGNDGDFELASLLMGQARIFKTTASRLSEHRRECDERWQHRKPPQMAAYVVVARNKWFYQRLVVMATSNVDAAQKFRAYLKSPEKLAHEENELSRANRLNHSDEDPEELKRDNYRYNLYTVEIGEFAGEPKWTGKPSKEVQVIDAGDNG